MPENVAILEQLGHNVIGNDFMKAPVQPVYDLIIANPPFTKNQDIQHITKMYEMLAPNGQLITLASPSWTFNESIAHTAFKNFIEEECDMGRASWEELAAGEFKESGTNIRTTLIYMRKPLGL